MVPPFFVPDVAPLLGRSCRCVQILRRAMTSAILVSRKGAKARRNRFAKRMASMARLLTE